MKRSSKYYTLRYFVECKWPHNSFYETIAAFDSERVAEAYAAECKKTNLDFVYRTFKRNY
jgi:hypothetical protein